EAPLRPQQGVHGRCDRFIAGHVEREHLECALARGRAAPTRAIDLVAGRGEPLRGCLPDARWGSRYECDRVLELHWTALQKVVGDHCTSSYDEHHILM